MTVKKLIFHNLLLIYYLLDDLNAKRQPEIEYYYEDLLGIRNDTFNTEILAAVIDYVTFDVTDMGFKIYIERVYR